MEDTIRRDIYGRPIEKFFKELESELNIVITRTLVGGYDGYYKDASTNSTVCFLFLGHEKNGYPTLWQGIEGPQAEMYKKRFYNTEDHMKKLKEQGKLHVVYLWQEGYDRRADFEKLAWMCSVFDGEELMY